MSSSPIATLVGIVMGVMSAGTTIEDGWGEGGLVMFDQKE